MTETATKITLALLAYFSPVHEIFVMMMCFVAVDLITGAIASKNRHVPRSSRRLRKSVIKTVCYIVAVLLAFYAEKVLHIEWFASHRFIAAFICVIELLSILENFAVITEHPVFLKLIKLIRGKASQDNVVNEIINEKNDFSDCHVVKSYDSELSEPKSGNDRKQIGYIRYTTDRKHS